MIEPKDIYKRFSIDPKYADLFSDLRSLLEEAANPPETLLDLLVEADQMTNKMLFKEAVRAYILLQAQNLLKAENFTRNIQDRAFHMLCQKEKPKNGVTDRKFLRILPSFTPIFNFDDLSEPMDVHVKKFIAEGDYVSAGCLLVFCDNELKDLFNDVMMELIVPIFILDKAAKERGRYDSLMTQLVRATDTQWAFVQFLDKCLAMNIAQKRQIIASYQCMPKNAIIAFDQVKKTLKDKIKIFHYKKEDFPNLKHCQAEDDLYYRYFLWKKRELTAEQFEDHGRMAMEQGEWLQQLFVDRLIKEKNYQEASKWARYNAYYKKLNQEDEPYNLLDVESRYARGCPKKLKRGPTEPYTLDGFEVHFVETATKEQIIALSQVVSNIPNDSIVTLDCENRSSYISCQESIALLQFAIDNKAYVIDAHSMSTGDEAMRQAWKGFLEILFSSGNHRIFGLGIKDDIMCIGRTFPTFKSISKKRIINSDKLIQQLQKGFPQNKELCEINVNIGLRDLYKTLFPKEREMDKSERMSCFDRRPLRKAQMDYAARDVIVLQKIYDGLKELVSSEKNGLEEFEHRVTVCERL